MEYEWWRARLLIDGFNEACSNIVTSYLKVGYESMSSLQFCTTSKGDLPQLSYIFRKLEPLGTEFKMVPCSITGALILIEIQRGKQGMKSSQYNLELVSTSVFTKILMEEMKELGQRSLKGSTRYFFLFDSWFSSKKAAEAATSIGVDLIGMVKTNTKGFSRLP